MDTNSVCDFPGPAVFWNDQIVWVESILRRHADLACHHKVLDIGAGPLRIGHRLIAFLDADCYYAIEPVEHIFNQGKELIPAPLWRRKRPRVDHNSTFDLGVFGCQFDVVLAHNVFIHCGDEQFCACLQNLPAELKEDGTFVCSLFLDKEDKEVEGKAYPHCSHRFVFRRRERVAEMVRAAGLRVDNVIHFGKGAMREKEYSHHLLIRRA